MSPAPQNNLLRHLRSADLERLKPHLEPVPAKVGQVLYEPGEDVRQAYFPCGPAMVSYIVRLEPGRDVETVLVGREGAVGGIVSEGHLPAFSRCIVQTAGDLLRVDVSLLEQAKQQSAAVAQIMARYADCLMAQVFQSVACNAAHSIEQRTAKWLVAAIDRTGDRSVTLTQEQLASMLGVGRSYISRVLGRLKEEGLLETRRGRLQVTDLPALGRMACDCHRRVRQHFDTVLGGVYPSAEESAALTMDITVQNGG